MSYGKLFGLVIGLTLMLLLVGGCGSAPAATPAAEAPVATATLPPTAALIAPTATPVPPTLQPTPTPQPTKPATQAKGELIHEKITSQALAGNLVGDPAERGYNIYLPPGYADGNKHYPVVYILHGATGNENQFLSLKGVYENILRKGTAQEMILVFPDGNNKFRANNYISSPTIGDYETYIARELVAQIDSKYRTIPHRDSRGITGCSMGGDGSMHLALTFPDVFSVAVPMSANYDFANDPTIPDSAAAFTHVPENFNELNGYWWVGTGNTAWYISLAAGAAPNPDKPPFYLDMPFEVVDGQGRVVPEVWEKIAAVDEVHDLEEYLQQPIRLHHILLMHGEYEQEAPVELARSFDRLLTARGVEHEYMEFKSGHCSYDMTPALQYLSDHLLAEQPSVSEGPTVTLDSALVSKIEAAIEKEIKFRLLPGLALGIVKDGQLVYSKGFGLAEVDTDRVVTPETVFQLASESKMMVGIAIMQLKEQGKLDLDAPVTTYLPYFQLADERYQEITLRQLLSHRSGLPFSTDYVSDYLSPQYDEASLERHVRRLDHLKMGSAPPGTQMQYSDIGFEILGDVIAKVSGQSFEDYTQDHIFTPLGMQDTTFLVQEVPPELLAAPHEFGASQPKVTSFFPYSRQHAPSSHLFSNVEDMSRFALVQFNRGQLGDARILPAAAYEEMWTPQGPTNLGSFGFQGVNSIVVRSA
jgi:CubicO group peptidase (beta-lactamase class C family)/enterochelin esterase-like enzyme